VKFNQPSNAYRVVHRAVRAQLEKAPWLDEFLGENNNTGATGQSPKAYESKTDSFFYDDKSTSLSFKDSALNKTHFPQKNFDMQETKSNPSLQTQSSEGFEIAEENVLSNSEIENKVIYSNTHLQKMSEQETSINTSENTHEKRWSNLQVLGQTDLTYIVTQSDNSLILVDQHAAHERVAFEKLMWAWKKGQIDVQNLLLPFSFKFDEEQLEALLSQVKDLERLGIYVEQMGAEHLAVSAHPQLIKESALKWSLEQLAQEIVEKGDGFSVEKMIGDLCATLACHSVIRAGQALSVMEMQDLLIQMDEFPFSSFCPHGRPVYVEYPFSKIEKDFGRIV
jgi:DNA mismatch repair protein MutL